MSGITLVLQSLLVIAFADVRGSPGKPPCCFPDKITGRAYDENHKFLMTVYWDFEKGLALEEWGGREGVAHRLYYLNDDVVYTRHTDGSCTKAAYAHLKYYRKCLPPNAEHYHVPAQGGVQMDGYRFELDHDLTMDFKVTSQNCLVRVWTVETPHDVVTQYYDEVPAIADPNVFNVDTSSRASKANRCSRESRDISLNTSMSLVSTINMGVRNTFSVDSGSNRDRPKLPIFGIGTKRDSVQRRSRCHRC